VDVCLTSVVIPAKGRPGLLARALRTVVRQTLPPAEVIVVDDGSPYPVREAVPSGLRARARWIRHEPGVNAAYARNLGIESAGCELIALLDADDCWADDHLRLATERMADTASDAVFSAYWAGGLFERVDIVRARHGPAHGESIADYLFVRGGSVRNSTLVVRRDVARRVAFAAELGKHQDWDFVLRLAEHGRVTHHGIPTVVIDHAASGRMSASARPEETRRFLDRNSNRLDDIQRNGVRIRAARNALEVGDLRAAGALLGEVRGDRLMVQRIRALAYRLLAGSPGLTRVSIKLSVLIMVVQCRMQRKTRSTVGHGPP